MSAARAFLSLLLCGLLPGCGGDSPTEAPAGEPRDQDRLLTIDGIDVTFGDVRPWVAFLDGYYAVHSTRSKMRSALDRHVLPLLLARRDFPAERAAQLEKARALRSVAGNAVELDQKGRLLAAPRKAVNPALVELPVARFAFDETLLGSVSEPLELPQGWLLVATLDLQHAAVAGDDIAELLQVPFYTHERDDHLAWLDQTRKAMADKVTWIHPDYRDVLPDWLRPPPPPAPSQTR